MVKALKTIYNTRLLVCFTQGCLLGTNPDESDQLQHDLCLTPVRRYKTVSSGIKCYHNNSHAKLLDDQLSFMESCSFYHPLHLVCRLPRTENIGRDL